MFVMMKL